MKAVVILLACILGLGVVALVRHQDRLWGDGERGSASQDDRPVPTLPALDAAAVHAITIKDSAGSRRLVKAEGAWTVEDRFGAPAKSEAVEQVFANLAGLGDATLVGENPSLHPNYDLSETAAKTVKFESASGQMLLELLIGRADLSRGSAQRGTFVREAGKNAVFLHMKPLTTLLRSDHRAWLDLRLNPKDQAEVVKLVDAARRIVLEYDDVNLGTDEEPPNVTHTGERVRLVLEGEKVATPVVPEEDVLPKPTTPPAPRKEYEIKWRVVEPEAAREIECYTPMVDPLVRQLLGGVFDDVKGRDPSDPALGLDKPAIDLTVTFEDGSTRSLKIGATVPPQGDASAPAAGQSRYAQIGGNPFVVSVSTWMCRMFQKKPDELKNPTPPPATAPGENPGAIVVPPESGRGGDEKKDR